MLITFISCNRNGEVPVSITDFRKAAEKDAVFLVNDCKNVSGGGGGTPVLKFQLDIKEAFRAQLKSPLESALEGPLEAPLE